MFGYERTLRTLHEMLKNLRHAQFHAIEQLSAELTVARDSLPPDAHRGRLIIKPRLHHHAKADLDMDQTWWHHESLSLRIGYLKLRPNHSMETGEPAFGKVKWFSNGGRDRVFSLAMLRSDRAYRPEQWEVEWFAAKKPVIDAILLATAHLTKMREELDMVLKYHYDASVDWPDEERADCVWDARVAMDEIEID